MKKRNGVKRCITYDRVSTYDQAYGSDGKEKADSSPEAQKQRCVAHIKYLEQTTLIKRELVEQISDKAYSGKNTNRPGYQRMFDLISARRVDEVVATELSRLSRSVVDFLELVAHCQKHDTDLVIIGLQLDTGTPFGLFMVTILVALAQFEREMTGTRVRENALARLLKDGKINGAAEILGLDRDPNRKGHFLLNEEELLVVEKILKLFVKFSSRKKTLEAAKKMGLTGKKGRELTIRTIDYILENAKWRYAGKWYANKDNKDNLDPKLSDSKKYQVVNLPHGKLIKDNALLDDVQSKLTDTHLNFKRSGAKDYTYLLSHVLYSEDGSKYSGQPAKNLMYRYYYNKVNKTRIDCTELDSLVVKEFKKTILDDESFKEMLERAVTKRLVDLPSIRSQIKFVERELRELEVGDLDLRSKLLSATEVKSADLMNWIEEQVVTSKQRREQLQNDLGKLKRHELDIVQKASLSELKKLSTEFMDKFDSLSGTEKRNTIEKLVEKVVIRSDQTLEIQFYGEPKLFKPVTRRKSTDKEEIGVTNGA